MSLPSLPGSPAGPLPDAQAQDAQQQAAVDQPTAREQQLYQMIQEQRTLIESLQGTLTSLQTQVTASSSTGTNQRTGIVDTRVLGKPDTFNGQNWRDWSTVFRAYTAATDLRLGQAMALAEIRDAPCLNASLSTEQAAVST